MERTNMLTGHATERWHKRCACDWMRAQCAHWNQLTYRRRQAYFLDGGDVWDVNTTDLYEKYGPVTGTGTAQQIKRKNDDAWNGFFDTLSQYYNGELDAKPSPPGYWGNEREGYELHGLVRNDQYEINWNANKSTVEFTVGQALWEKYDMDYQQKLGLEVRGNPRWKGEDSQLELQFDESRDCFRVHHPVTVRPDYIDTVRTETFTQPPTTGSTKHAAIDIGANNTLTILTEDGNAAVYHARPQFNTFQHGRTEIAKQQSKLPDGTYTSARIERLFDTVYGRRDHHRDACLKHAAKWLLEHDVTSVFVGDLSDVLSTHWRASVNEKTHAFWSHGQLTDQLDNTFELAEIEVEYVDEYDTSSECPHCQSEHVSRHGDQLLCRECSLVTHSDIAGASNILSNETSSSVSSFFRPMARPAGPAPGRTGRVHLTHLEWNDHEWTPHWEGTLGSFDQRGISKPQRSSVVTPGRVAQGGIPRL